LGELIAVGDFVEGANGEPTIVSQQRATDGSGEPIGDWQTTVTKAPVDEQPVLVQPEPQIISGYQIGQAFGSALGQLIGGSNTFARVAAGSALGVVLGNVGETLQIHFNDTWVSGSAPPQNVTLAQAAELSFANFGAELASGFASAGLGAASAYLTAELAESLGINANGIGGQLGSACLQVSVPQISAWPRSANPPTTSNHSILSRSLVSELAC
ncbi:MAG TPA: hypothetical protein VLD67_09305, partial [Vicinamibacterales bacterium]|nr:hypothetical protein [Vicinamibacterales bacterium]